MFYGISLTVHTRQRTGIPFLGQVVDEQLQTHASTEPYTWGRELTVWESTASLKKRGIWSLSQ